MQRINFFGCPNSGKTTLAVELFSKCKKLGINCEYINELAREWAYVDRSIQSMDQVYLFATQMHREDSLLSRSKVKFVITDSPIWLNAFYGVYKNSNLYKGFSSLCREFDKKFSAINIFCRFNSNYNFNQSGRHHSIDQLIWLDKEIFEFVSDYCQSNLEKLYVLDNTQDRLEQTFEILKDAGVVVP